MREERKEGGIEKNAHVSAGSCSKDLGLCMRVSELYGLWVLFKYSHY